MSGGAGRTLRVRELATARSGDKGNHANIGVVARDEAAFVAYVEGQLKERGQPFDAAKFLVSPRDGQKYVVKYGKEFANLGSTNVVVHEKDGYDGKVYVGYQIGRVDEVDAAELPTLLQSKP